MANAYTMRSISLEDAYESVYYKYKCAMFSISKFKLFHCGLWNYIIENQLCFIE